MALALLILLTPFTTGCATRRPPALSSTPPAANGILASYPREPATIRLTSESVPDVEGDVTQVGTARRVSWQLDASEPVKQTTLQENATTDDGLVERAPLTLPDPDSEQLSNPPPSDASETMPNDTDTTALDVDAVIDSVIACYPEIAVAIGEIEAAQGKVLASWGEFDTTLSGGSISQPLGFYETYRNGVAVNRPLFGGGEVFAGYRIGDGNFEPWYGERETDEAGELKAGFSLPLIKDRAIDARRADLGMADAQLNAVTANVESRLLETELAARQAYWTWLATGLAVTVRERILALAEARVDQINIRVERGDLAELARIDNDRFIAKRTAELIKARREFEKSAIKLSLFLRDENCVPLIATRDWLPEAFRDATSIAADQLQSDIIAALANRPELEELAAERQATLVALQYADNLMLPKLDLKAAAGQDLGGAASSKRDKSELELEVGVMGEVPIERRTGRGKRREALGKLAQIDAKLTFTSDKIRAQLNDAASAVNAAAGQIEQSTQNVELTQQSLNLGRRAFEAGDIDLIALNIYETAVADAQLELLEAQLRYFVYRAAYDIARRGVAFE